LYPKGRFCTLLKTVDKEVPENADNREVKRESRKNGRDRSRSQGLPVALKDAENQLIRMDLIK